MADEIGYVKGGIPGWTVLADEAHEKNPDLQWPMSLEVYDQMRREDAQVGSVLRAVTLPIRSARWEVDPAGASDAVVRQIAQDLGLPVKGEEAPPQPTRQRGRFSWAEFLRLALLELPFGHSVFEQVYRIENGRTRLRKLAWRPPRTISKFDVAKDGGLIAIEQHGVFGSTTVRIPVDRLVVFVNEREGANWLGKSLLREAYKDWLLKDRFLRIQALVAERNGLGVPIYEGPELPEAVARDATKAEQWLAEQRDDGLKMAKDFRAGEASGGYIPHGAKFTLTGVTGKLPDMDAPIRYHDEQIAKAVLAHFLTLGGDRSTGSYALGDTFAEFFTGSLNAVMDHIADVVQQHVVEDLVDVNWGPNEPAPRIVPAKLGKDHPLTAEGVRALVECGAFTADAELEKYLRARYGLPAPDDATARPRPATAQPAEEAA
ncbi:phage portal protein family protein [Microbacterium resistens]|uniref:phage portal protein family protein n=1 Tax=Microbacterium resistens TaxID=156977 RepID=UPI003671AFB5